MDTNQLCLHRLFQDQVERTPDAIAVVDGDYSITYRELDHLTDCLAGYLQKHGVAFDEAVGIFMETCADYVMAYIAILKAGGAYMPLDLAYPNSLLEKIFAEAAPKVVVTKSRYTDRLDSDLPLEILTIDADNAWREYKYAEEAVSSLAPDNLAFVAYTAGTTGEPKGVLQTHRAAVHSYFCRYDLSSYEPGDRVACNIFFVWELLRPLLRGGACYVVPDEIIYDPRRLVNFISERKITEILFTPSLLETTFNSVDADLIRSQLSSLKTVWLNGEVVTTKLKNRALEALPGHVRLLNTYSISECHDVSSGDLRDIEDLPSGICMVGRPIPGVEVKLLDENMRQAPPGATGELYIGGPCLAKGYLDKPELTAERFVWINGSRFYKTGDLAQIHPNGNLEIKGRHDFMVKIRGYSIHLGAVETALLEYANVKSCAVIAEGEEGEDKRLVAYIVRDETADWKIDERTGVSLEIRNELKLRLPHYMIPSVYVELDEIPIHTVTGKLNRKLLPSPTSRYEHHFEDIRLSETPSQEEQEDAMCALWERLLFLERGTITRDSVFFDFGGHSLLAVELATAIEEVFGVQLLVKDIYEHETVSALVQYIRQGAEGVTQEDSIWEDACLDSSIVPATARKPLSLNEADSVFITGTTGFLGAFLLDELMRATDEHVKFYCLARTRNGSQREALDRIVNNLKHYDLYSKDANERIVPVAGDLAKSHFGLSPERYSELAREVDIIFHCASLVNYVYSYAVIKPTTVDGTREVLRFACESVAKPLHYISTNGVFPSGNTVPYPETSDIDSFADGLEGGYSKAKWVAEKLVWEAVSRGLPACLYRPGNIGHHSDTGKANPKDFQGMIINACVKVDCAPCIDSWVFEMTPVDFLVKAIALFAGTPSHYGRVFNIVQSDTTPARRVFDLLLEMNLVSELVSMDEWKARLYAKAERDGDHLLSVLAQSLEDVESHLNNGSIYDTSGFESALSAHHLRRPAVDVDYFRKAL